MIDPSSIDRGKATSYVPRRPRALTNALVLTQIAAAITFLSRAMCMGDLPTWMAVVPLTEGLLVGALLFVVATTAYRPSARAHQFLEAGYWIAIGDAALWIVGMFAFVVWARPDITGSDGEGPFDGVGVFAAALRAAWCAAKIKFCLWARPHLRDPDVLDWIARAPVDQPTTF